VTDGAVAKPFGMGGLEQAPSAPGAYNDLMAPEAAELLTNAHSLPAEERAKLAHELLLSLDGGADADAAEAWVNELQRRAGEVREGSVATEDWATVKARLIDRWRRR
jgi:hypothetical protein